MSKTILIGCKLPSGIVLDGPAGPIELNGMNTALVLGGFGLTHVKEDDWAYLSMMYEAHAAFKSNAIFTAGNANVADVAAVASELRDEKTGLEGIDPNKPAKGLEPDSAKLNESLKQNEGKPGATRKAKSKADVAAALELTQV